MKASKLREMSHTELTAQEDELTKQLFHLRFQLGGGQLESAKKIASVRRDLARDGRRYVDCGTARIIHVGGGDPGEVPCESACAKEDRTGRDRWRLPR